jgi:hypothetical protein
MEVKKMDSINLHSVVGIKVSEVKYKGIATWRSIEVSKEDGSYFEIIAFGDNRADLSIEVKK